MKKSILCYVLFFSALRMFSQVEHQSLSVPRVEGYEILKCDFHLHTVFSDGGVWPTVRVDEAVREGLDAIALTDHIEYRPKLKEFTSSDHNKSYEVAAKYAEANGVLLIRGTEITRRMAPGHFNALFIKDANAFASFVPASDNRDSASIVVTLEEAKRQGAFIHWNHPWFQHKDNISEWAPVHQTLYDKGLINGIEVVNGGRYDQVILDWCLSKDVTVISNTDAHAPIIKSPSSYRDMTLVFARTRSLESIHDALKQRMTIGYSEGMIFGKEELLDMFVAASLKVEIISLTDKVKRMIVHNVSGVPFTCSSFKAMNMKARIGTNRPLQFPANATVSIDFTPLDGAAQPALQLEVANALTHQGKQLVTIIK